jgi:hypothetical protein
MPIKRINQFPEGSGSLSSDDVFLFMDDPSGSGITKKISLSQISSAIGGGGGGGVTLEEVQDNLGNGFLVSGTGIFLNYNDNSNTLTISATGVSFNNHSHVVSDITNFNSGVSGLLPVKNISGGSYISISSSGGTYTISATGLQASGNYSTVGHTHLVSNITDFTEGVQDVVGSGGFLIGTSGINIGYNDSSNTLNIGYSTRVVSLTFNTTLNTNASSGDIFDVTLTDNTTLANPSNSINGKTIRWRILQDNTGGRSVTLDNKFVIPTSASSPLPWSTSGNAMDILAATYHAGRDKWDVVAFVPGY